MNRMGRTSEVNVLADSFSPDHGRLCTLIPRLSLCRRILESAVRFHSSFWETINRTITRAQPFWQPARYQPVLIPIKVER